MNTNYFSKVRILDGGLGQLLLAKGLVAKGSLWSATALVNEKNHQMIVDAHLDYINSGADVIVTNNFAARRVRMVENKVEEHFNYANKKAGELALKAKKISKKNVLIAGSLPAQNNTYSEDQRDKKMIEKGFHDQAILLEPFVDFFYLDVLCGSKEVEIALNAINQFNNMINETIDGLPMLKEDTDSYNKVVDFIHKKKSVTKKEILDYLGWGVRISFSGYRNRLRTNPTIRFTRNRYEVI